MNQPPDFKINSTGPISTEFVRQRVFTFQEATAFVKHLPYGRNADKSDLTKVFADGCGTCSTKHGLLKLLADENDFVGLELVLGLFKMNGRNTIAVAKTLQKNGLDYIPEAHNYLTYYNQVLDFTHSYSNPTDFAEDVMEEIIIHPNQITDYKVAYHRSYFTEWLKNNPYLNFSIDELWEIREQCIKDLAEGAFFISRPS